MSSSTCQSLCACTYAWYGMQLGIMLIRYRLGQPHQRPAWKAKTVIRMHLANVGKRIKNKNYYYYHCYYYYQRPV